MDERVFGSSGSGFSPKCDTNDASTGDAEEPIYFTPSAYQAYVGSAELCTRYAANNFVLLVATTTASYRRKLMTATANMLYQASDRHLFTTLANLHPLTIGTWFKIGGVAPTHENVVGGAKTSYAIEESEHVLLR